ncbi:immunogenic protein [Diplocarpon rosae]|nr:immunogenic protein [Diplocarpon rosae]
MSAEQTKIDEVPTVTTEAPKPAEESPVLPADASAEIPVATEPSTAAEETPQEEVAEAAPVVEEVKPIEEGILGYKGPGLLKSFIFQKKFFYFGSEPVESKTLSSYLRGEKSQETANKNVAWASHTGKGLLFFTKKASEKGSPDGIINLSGISDLTEEGTNDFVFTLGGSKHIFKAASLTERNAWVSALKAKVAEASEIAPSVVESAEYKKAHTDLTKPASAPVSTPKKSVDKTEAMKEDKKEEKAEEKAEKKDRKSRSASRKRNSLFGGFGIGKKEEKPEAPAASEETPAPVADSQESPSAPVVDASEPVPAPITTESTQAVEETPAATEKPATSKRNSIFGTLKSQFSQSKEKKAESETPPAVPAKEAEPVSESAPVIPAVEASEPLATSVAAPASVPTETVEVPVTNGETKPAETPITKAEKRKSSLPWLNKKEKATTPSDEETEKPKSPFAKLRATVKSKSSSKAEKVTEKPATAEETPEEIQVSAVTEPEKVVPATNPAVSASA